MLDAVQNITNAFKSQVPNLEVEVRLGSVEMVGEAPAHFVLSFSPQRTMVYEAGVLVSSTLEVFSDPVYPYACSTVFCATPEEAFKKVIQKLRHEAVIRWSAEGIATARLILSVANQLRLL